MRSDMNNNKEATQVKEQLSNRLKALIDSPPIDNNCFLRLQVPVQSTDLIQWLKIQTDEVKTYWRDREGKFEMAGLGEADIVSGSLMPNYNALFLRLNEYLKNTKDQVRYYGGMRFNKKHSSDFKWQAFTSYLFLVPKFEILRKGTDTVLVCNLLLRSGENISKIIQKALSQLEAIRFDTLQNNHSMPTVKQRIDYPDFDGWKKNIEQALSAFAHKELDKIVLARRTTLKFNDYLNPIELLWKLRLNNHRAYYFCFQPQNDVAFIGGSPEQLYSRTKNYIMSEAVAGTRRRGSTTSEDLVLENDLLNCEKDIREHRFVVDSIRGSLDKLCLKIQQQDELSVVKLSKLQHLLMKFSGLLKEKTQDSDILESIHPTPAVGGVPSEKASAEIENIENFDRGWYAGPVGWIGKDEAEFAVAIRSGLVFENELYLYSGAGIVEGSNPENEWEEIENKIAGFMNALDENIPVAEKEKILTQ